MYAQQTADTLLTAAIPVAAIISILIDGAREKIKQVFGEARDRFREAPVVANPDHIAENSYWRNLVNLCIGQQQGWQNVLPINDQIVELLAPGVHHIIKENYPGNENEQRETNLMNQLKIDLPQKISKIVYEHVYGNLISFFNQAVVDARVLRGSMMSSFTVLRNRFGVNSPDLLVEMVVQGFNARNANHRRAAERTAREIRRSFPYFFRNIAAVQNLTIRRLYDYPTDVGWDEVERKTKERMESFIQRISQYLEEHLLEIMAETIENYLRTHQPVVDYFQFEFVDPGKL